MLVAEVVDEHHEGGIELLDHLGQHEAVGVPVVGGLFQEVKLEARLFQRVADVSHGILQHRRVTRGDADHGRTGLESSGPICGAARRRKLPQGGDASAKGVIAPANHARDGPVELADQPDRDVAKQPQPRAFEVVVRFQEPLEGGRAVRA